MAAAFILLCVFAPHILTTIAAVVFGLLILNLIFEGVADLFSSAKAFINKVLAPAPPLDKVCNKPIYYHNKK